MCVRNWNHGLNSDVYKSYRDKNRIFICIKNSQQPSWNIGTVLSMRVLISFFQNIDLSYISKIGNIRALCKSNLNKKKSKNSQQ